MVPKIFLKGLCYKVGGRQAISCCSGCNSKYETDTEIIRAVNNKRELINKIECFLGDNEILAMAESSRQFAEKVENLRLQLQLFDN